MIKGFTKCLIAVSIIGAPIYASAMSSVLIKMLRRFKLGILLSRVFQRLIPTLRSRMYQTTV